MTTCLERLEIKRSCSSLGDSDDFFYDSEISDEADADMSLLTDNEEEQLKIIRDTPNRERRRVSAVPTTTSIIEDQFLEEVCNDIGYEHDKGADKMTRNDRKRAVRRVSEQLLNHRKASQTTLKSVLQTNGDIEPLLQSEPGYDILEDRKSAWSRYLTSHVLGDSKSSMSMIEMTPKKSTTSQGSSEIISETSNEALLKKVRGGDNKPSRHSSKRASNASIATKPQSDSYTERLDHFRRNTLTGIRKGSIGGSEIGVGLTVIRPTMCEAQSEPASRRGTTNSEHNENENVIRRSSSGMAGVTDETLERKLSIIRRKSNVSLQQNFAKKRYDAVVLKPANDKPKTVSTADGTSAYPLPGSQQSTKQGGTWSTTKAAHNLISDAEIMAEIKTVKKEKREQIRKLKKHDSKIKLKMSRSNLHMSSSNSTLHKSRSKSLDT